MALHAQHHQAELLKVDGARPVRVDCLYHREHFRLGGCLPELPEHEADLLEVDVAATITVKLAKGAVPLLDGIALAQVRVAVAEVPCPRFGARAAGALHRYTFSAKKTTIASRLLYSIHPRVAPGEGGYR